MPALFCEMPHIVGDARWSGGSLTGEYEDDNHIVGGSFERDTTAVYLQILFSGKNRGSQRGMMHASYITIPKEYISLSKVEIGCPLPHSSG